MVLESSHKFSVAAVLVVVAEGNNVYRMYRFHSPWYGPLGFAVLAVGGAALATGPRRAKADQTVDEPGTAPNGGHATQFSNSGVTEGRHRWLTVGPGLRGVS